MSSSSYARSADVRRRAGTLEFHDLLVLARDLLRRDTAVRTSLARRYPHLLLDEFQDTDPIQIELAVLLTTDDPDAGSKPWPEITVRPGALVVVGDPKQSIYRFRRADLGMYHDAQRRLMLEQCTLVESFRSVPGVIEFVNGVFAELLIEQPRVQAAHIALHASRAAIGHDHPVGIFGQGVDANVGDIRAEEADDVADIVRRIKDEEWLVDGEAGPRFATFADIALLIPSRTVLPALEDALERADIPVRVESQSLVFSTGDVRDLLAVLAAIDDPTDEIAVVAALRSPAFGCTDSALGGPCRRRWPLGLPEAPTRQRRLRSFGRGRPCCASRLLGAAVVAQRKRDARSRRARTPRIRVGARTTPAARPLAPRPISAGPGVGVGRRRGREPSRLRGMGAGTGRRALQGQRVRCART